MKKRSFTVRHADGSEETYLGFDKDFRPSELNTVVLTLCDGEIEVYAMDDSGGKTDLLRYLCDMSPNSIIIGYYKRCYR